MYAKAYVFAHVSLLILQHFGLQSYGRFLICARI